MWLIIISSVLIAAAAGTVYLVAKISRFGWIKKAAGDRKLLRFLIALAAVSAVFALFSVLLSAINTIIILLHLVVFFLIIGVILRIIKKYDTEIYWQGWLSLAATAVYLAIGAFLCFHVWQTDYTLHTDKQPGELKIALFADSHVGATFDGDGFAEHIKTIEAQQPDILVIAGDYVDDWSTREDMLRACEALGNADIKYGVWLAFGNHDEGRFNDRTFSAEELRQALTDNGIHILEDDCELVDGRFYVAGRRDSMHGERKSMDELLENADKSKYIIVLDHEPNDYENEAGKCDLVLSGHTHGGQLIPIRYVGVLFGIVDREYGYENRSGTDFIVTSGISDWEILFKTGTKSEYVIITVE